MNSSLIDELRRQDLLRSEQHAFLRAVYDRRIVSLHAELRTLLYLGVMLVATGVGLLIYENIEHLGPSLRIAGLTLLVVAGFGYALWRRPPFSRYQVATPTVYFDYILLLSALLFATLIAYLQYEYTLFGQNWGLAAVIPAVVYAASAYFFDHRGVLALAVTAAASAVGLEISAVNWFRSGLFQHESLLVPGIAFSSGVLILALVLERLDIKKHFTFTYMMLSLPLLYGSLLAALISFDQKWLYFLLLALVSAGGVVYARRTQSFITFTYAVIFGYIGATYMLVRLMPGMGLFWMSYFWVSAAGIVLLILKGRRFLNPEAKA